MKWEGQGMECPKGMDRLALLAPTDGLTSLGATRDITTFVATLDLLQWQNDFDME